MFLSPYFESYETLIHPLTDRYPLRRQLCQTFRVVIKTKSVIFSNKPRKYCTKVFTKY